MPNAPSHPKHTMLPFRYPSISEYIEQCIRLTAARACSKGTGEVRMQRPAGDIHQTGRKEDLGRIMLGVFTIVTKGVLRVVSVGL